MKMRTFGNPRKYASMNSLAWPVGIFGILGCAYLFYSLPQRTQIWFLCAHVVGIAIYLLYGARRSVGTDMTTSGVFK